MNRALSIRPRFFSMATLVACAVLSGGCLAESYDGADDADFIDDSSDVVAETEDELTGGTNTTSYVPVVRIQTSKGYCVATAISDSLLITAANCLKSGTGAVSVAMVSVAHGANASAAGKYSSDFIMSAAVYDAAGAEAKRDIAFIKFGAGTFSVWSPLGSIASGTNIAGQSVNLVGFSGNTKSWGTDTIVSFGFQDTNYALATTNNTNGVADISLDDRGGPMFRVNGSSIELIGVLSGTTTNSSGTFSLHSLVTEPVYDHLYAVLMTMVPNFCAENYQHADFDGWGLSYCHWPAINSTLSNNGFSDPFAMYVRWNYNQWNDQISSLTIPDHMSVTLFEHASNGGKYVTFQSIFPFGNGQNISDLSDYGFNDITSSFSMGYSTSPSNTKWQIEITRYGKCLDLYNGNTNNGGNILQWDCGQGNTNQIFRIEAVGSYYQIKHNASGKCLDVSAYGTTDGTNIQLWSCTGADNQLFSITSNATTDDVRDFTVKGKQSGKCLDLDHGGTANGTNIQLWTCGSTNPSQTFALRAAL